MWYRWVPQRIKWTTLKPKDEAEDGHHDTVDDGIGNDNDFEVEVRVCEYSKEEEAYRDFDEED